MTYLTILSTERGSNARFSMQIEQAFLMQPALIVGIFFVIRGLIAGLRTSPSMIRQKSWQNSLPRMIFGTMTP